MGMITFDTACVPEGGVPLAPPPPPEPEPEPVVVVVEKDNTALKVGIVVTVVVIVLIIAIVLYICMRRKFHEREQIVQAYITDQAEEKKRLHQVSSSKPDESEDLELA